MEMLFISPTDKTHCHHATHLPATFELPHVDCTHSNGLSFTGDLRVFLQLVNLLLAKSFSCLLLLLVLARFRLPPAAFFLFSRFVCKSFILPSITLDAVIDCLAFVLACSCLRHLLYHDAVHLIQRGYPSGLSIASAAHQAHQFQSTFSFSSLFSVGHPSQRSSSVLLP